MKMRNVIAAIVLSLSLIACCTPVVTSAQETDPQLIPETLWEGCEYYGSADFNAEMEGATLIDVTSSNPDIIKVHMEEIFSALYDYYLEPLAPGTSDISVTYSMGGQTKTATALFTVKPFPAFVTSLTVDNMPVDLGTYKNYYDLYNYTGTTPNIKFALGDDWKLDGAYTFSEEVNLTTSEDGVAVDLPETCNYAGVFIDFVNSSGEMIMYGVRFYRDSGESEYDPDDDPIQPDPVTPVQPQPTPSVQPQSSTATQETPAVAAGEVQSVAGSTVKVTSVTANTVSFTKAKKNAKAVTVPATVTLSDGETYKVTQVEANAFKGSNATSVTLSKNITTLKAKAFNGSKVKTITVKTSKLTKSSVKNSLKGSKVTTIKVNVGSKNANKKTVAAYKKIFTKKITGKKVTVK